MIQHIGELLGNFLGPANQTQCFVHTINLIAKSILKPFDTRKSKGTEDFDDVAQALAKEQEQETDNDDNDEDNDDKDEDDKLVTRLEPIRSMLLKVRLCHRP